MKFQHIIFTLFIIVFFALPNFILAQEDENSASEETFEDIHRTKQKIRGQRRVLPDAPPPRPPLGDLDLYYMKKNSPLLPTSRIFLSLLSSILCVGAFAYSSRRKLADFPSTVVGGLILCVNIIMFGLKALNLSVISAYLQISIFLVPLGLTSVCGLFGDLFTVKLADLTQNGKIFSPDEITILATITEENVVQSVGKLKATFDANVLRLK